MWAADTVRIFPEKLFSSGERQWPTQSMLHSCSSWSALSLCFDFSSPCVRTSRSRAGSSPRQGLHPWIPHHSEEISVPTSTPIWEHQQFQTLHPGSKTHFHLAKESCLKIQARAAYFESNKWHFFRQKIAWHPAMLAILAGCWVFKPPSAISCLAAWLHTCSSWALAWGMRASKPTPQELSICMIYMCILHMYGIHICNVAMALPSSDDNIALQPSQHRWCQNTNTIKQSSRYWGYKHHNINPGPNSLNSFL